MQVSTEPKWRRRRDARPGELVAAALEAFADMGYAGTRIEEIARRAGVTVGTIYRYYDGKAALFEAVITQSIAPTLERGESLARRRGDDAELLLRRLVIGWGRLVCRRPRAGIVKMVVTESATFPELTRAYVREIIERGERILARALQHGVERGAFRPHDVQATARTLAHLVLYGALHDRALAAYDDRPFDPIRHIAHGLDLVLAGLRTEAPAR